MCLWPLFDGRAWLTRTAMKNLNNDSKKEEYLKLAKTMRLKAQSQMYYRNFNPFFMNIYNILDTVL
ncbi:MAG: hypothetical protein WD025_04895 [Bacteriovoracaceae bacterium]